MPSPPHCSRIFCIFFFNDTATTEIYTLSLHDALPISRPSIRTSRAPRVRVTGPIVLTSSRSEEHTSELQSLRHLVCRLLLEKKKNRAHQTPHGTELLGLHIVLADLHPADLNL